MRHAAHLFVAAAISLIAGAAVVAPSLAQQGMGPGMHMGPNDDQGMMMGPGRGGGFWGMMGMMGGGGCPMVGGGDIPTYREGRIAFLKAELAITEAQTKVWDVYAEALKKNLQSMQDMRESMLAARSAKTPVERLNAHITAMEGRLQALKDVKPALAALYDALSDDQKRTADDLLTGMGCMM
jgi:hypothetical protein